MRVIKRHPKEKPNLREAACLLLASKLYCDYMEAYGKVGRLGAEHFAEEWMRKCIPDNDRIRMRSIWMHFLCRLVERKNGKR